MASLVTSARIFSTEWGAPRKSSRRCRSVRLRAIGHEGETAISLARQRIDAVAEMEGRAKRLDLLHQAIGQLLARHLRQSGNVVDRLLGIELGALPAELVADV